MLSDIKVAWTQSLIKETIWMLKGFHSWFIFNTKPLLYWKPQPWAWKTVRSSASPKISCIQNPQKKMTSRRRNGWKRGEEEAFHRLFEGSKGPTEVHLMAPFCLHCCFVFFFVAGCWSPETESNCESLPRGSAICALIAQLSPMETADRRREVERRRSSCSLAFNALSF